MPSHRSHGSVLLQISRPYHFQKGTFITIVTHNEKGKNPYTVAYCSSDDYRTLLSLSHSQFLSEIFRMVVISNQSIHMRGKDCARIGDVEGQLQRSKINHREWNHCTSSWAKKHCHNPTEGGAIWEEFHWKWLIVRELNAKGNNDSFLVSKGNDTEGKELQTK